MNARLCVEKFEAGKATGTAVAKEVDTNLTMNTQTSHVMTEMRERNEVEFAKGRNANIMNRTAMAKKNKVQCMQL